MSDPADAGPSPGPDDFLRSRTLKRELLAELRASWEQGQPARPEDLLPRWPGDPAGDPDVASLLLEDYLQKGQREASGSATPQAPLAKHRDSLDSLIRQHDLLRSLGGAPSADTSLRLPEMGDRLFGFRLRHELGRGTFARVFLAEQTDLAGRLVVLKVSAIEGSEAQTLAQLQHTHIVPIFSVHEDVRAGLRALCMPYFGGACLARVLDDVRQRSRSPSSGQEVVDALGRVSAPDPDRVRSSRVTPRDLKEALTRAARPRHQGQTPRAALARLSYVGAVAWLGARLAEGLQHAHQRGVLHRDLKPSNILLGADGQPLLLDFNLAHDTRNSPAQATLGGTVAYMAPEHLRALASRDPAQAARVDHRSDVYSLGMVLFEMLVGRRPFEQSGSYAPLPLLVESMAVERSAGAPSARAACPDVPWGLESILRRCLAPEPGDRYQQAEELAEDLRRFLSDQPLRYAPELSVAERARKWARRHPRLTSTVAVCTAAVVLLAVAGLALAGVRSRLVHTREQLAITQALERKRQYEEGVARTLLLLNTTHELRDQRREGLAVCAKTLGLYGVLDRPDWQEHPDWQRLDAGQRRKLALDTRELLLLLADARVRLRPEDRQELGQALALVDKAEAVAGLPACRAVWVDRAAYRERLGDPKGAALARQQAARIAADGPRDHYLLARSFIRARQHDRAVGHLDEVLKANPRHYWCWVERGLCQLDRGKPALAAADFGACIGLWPEFAWGYYNRATALRLGGERAEALAAYNEALKLDPTLVVARYNRGVLLVEMGRCAEALADLDQGAAAGKDDAVLHCTRGKALEALGRHTEADEAFRLARLRAQKEPRPVRVGVLWAHGHAIAKRKQSSARAAFEEALREDPANREALYGLGMLLEWQGQEEEALRWYDRAVAAAPDFTHARRARAVLLARRGETNLAGTEINWCLRQERSGITLYAAACVAALHARETSGPSAARAREQALTFLKHAFEQGHGRAVARTDPDLEAMRQDRRFQQLLRPSSRTD